MRVVGLRSICDLRFHICSSLIFISHICHRMASTAAVNSMTRGLLVQGVQPKHGSFRRGRLIFQGMFNPPQLLDREQFLARSAAGPNAC